MTTQNPSVGTGRLATACLVLAAFAIGTDDLVIAGLLPQIAADLGVGVPAAGQLITVFSLTYAVSAPPLAVLTARWPRRPLFLGGLSLFALVNLVTALAPSYAALLVLRVVAAVLAAALTPTAFAMAAQMARPGREGSALGGVAAGLTVALFLGVPLGTSIGTLADWRWAFVFVAALSLAVLAASAVALPSLPGSPATRVSAQLRPLARPAVLLCVLGTVGGASCGYLVYTYVAPVTRDLTGAGGLTLAALIAVAGAAGVLGTVVCGRLTDAWGTDRSLIATFAGLVAACALLAVLGLFGEGSLPVWVLVAVFALWGFSAWGFAAPMSARVLALAGESGTEAVALNTGALYVGVTVAGAAGGAAVAGHGGTGAALAATGIGLAALVLMAVSVRVFPAAGGVAPGSTVEVTEEKEDPHAHR